MQGQVRFVMHPDDEQAFERELLAEKGLLFIDGPRWPSRTPRAVRSLASVRGDYCILWHRADLAVLRADHMEKIGDWYCKSEYATIQFLRSRHVKNVLTEGRLAVFTTGELSRTAAAAIDARYKRLRRYIQKNYTNKIVCWCNPKLPLLSAGPNRSANPSKPDAQVWVGPAALDWLRQRKTRRIKQFLQSCNERRSSCRWSRA